MLGSKDTSQDSMASSNPTNPTAGNADSQTESISRTVSRFPPLAKAKVEEVSNPKQFFQTGNITKKSSEEQVIPLLKKAVSKKKEEKKKPKTIQIKPEILERYRSYIQFISLISLSHNVNFLTPERPSYVMYVGKGNNSSLIKTIFRNYRPWWTIEEYNQDSPTINLFWFQSRQNEILENFKDNPKTAFDFQHCDIYLEEAIPAQKSEIVFRESSISSHKTQIRSQSVTQKDIRSSTKISLSKRSSSRTKGSSTEKNSPIVPLAKELREEGDNEAPTKKRKTLANPKMWPIYQAYRRIFNQNELRKIKRLGVIGEDWHIMGKLGRNKMRTVEGRSGYPKIHNHLANNWNLSNKKALFMNLKNYYDARKINPFEYIPMTFHVTEASDKQFSHFKEEYERRNEVIREEEKAKKNQQFKQYGFKPKKRNAWLVKPGENTNRGTGIEVVETLEEIQTILEGDKVDKLGRPRTHIIQEYIMPFLYHKRKFDIRSYILVTSLNGEQKGYWFQDGYIRTASKEFNMKNLTNKYIHLTNDAVQKYHQDYGKFEPGNKLSFADFQRYLDSAINPSLEPANKLKFYQMAYPEMKKLAADAIRSVYSKMDPTKKEFSFEIFGLDFLIDQGFKVWLIEANTNPCLELSCPLLGRLIPNMLENAFKIAIDPLFPPPSIAELVATTKKLVLPENPIENNKFELIFDEVEEGVQLRALLTNTPEVKIYDIEEQEEEYEDNQVDKRHLLEQGNF